MPDDVAPARRSPGRRPASVSRTNCPEAKPASASGWMPGPPARASSPARQHRGAQPEMPVRRGPVQPADHHHVGIAPGSEVDRALAQRRVDRRRTPPDRPDRCRTGCGVRSKIGSIEPAGGRLIAPGPCRRSAFFMPFWFSYSEPCSTAGGSGRRTGAGESLGCRDSPATIRALNFSIPAGKPRIGQASAARNWNSSSRRSLSRNIRRRPMHRPHMMHGDRARLAGQRDCLAEVYIAVRRVHRAAEHAIGVVVEGRTLVAARNDHQRAVLHSHVVEHDANRREVVIGMRVERPVLVPLHRARQIRRISCSVWRYRTECPGPTDPAARQ